MKLASLGGPGRDGRLVVVSTDAARYLPTEPPTLQAALDDWRAAEPALRDLAGRLATGEGLPLAGQRLLAPLPRAWQWLDGSAFLSHGDLMQRLFGVDAGPRERPLMYQGLSHRFLAPDEDVALPSENQGIDFEGEFAVATDAVPMGVTPDQARDHIKLVLQINDWSLRAIAPLEMRTGFGWIHAKPACSAAPFAVTPDALGSAWRDGRVDLDLAVDWNGARFGAPNGAAMAFGFHELVAHAAATRSLCAGTLIGSGTVSNADHQRVGSTCIAERRAIELLEAGAATTRFMRFGDRVRMEARDQDGGVMFGAIDQRVVQALPGAVQ